MTAATARPRPAWPVDAAPRLLAVCALAGWWWLGLQSLQHWPLWAGGMLLPALGLLGATLGRCAVGRAGGLGLVGALVGGLVVGLMAVLAVLPHTVGDGLAARHAWAAAALAWGLVLGAGATRLAGARGTGSWGCVCHGRMPPSARDPLRDPLQDPAPDPVRLAAALAMVPMMTSLPLMQQWCLSSPVLAPAVVNGLHGAVMLLPVLPLRPVLPPLMTSWRHHPRHVMATLLVGGAVLPWLSPGWAALMAGQLLQALAWGLLARAPAPPAPGASDTAAGVTRPAGTVQARRQTADPWVPLPMRACLVSLGRSELAVSVVAVSVVLAAGTAFSHGGPDALRLAQLALAVLALAGLLRQPAGWISSRAARLTQPVGLISSRAARLTQPVGWISSRAARLTQPVGWISSRAARLTQPVGPGAAHESPAARSAARIPGCAGSAKGSAGARR